MYRPGQGARKLDRKKSKGADGPSSGATGSFPLEAGVSSRKAASSRQSSADLVLARTLFMHACCISGLPSFLLFLPYSWLVPLFRLSSSRSLSSFLTPLSLPHWDQQFYRDWTCARQKRTGTNARTNSRCIVVSVCRKVTVQSASEFRSYNFEQR